MSPNPYDFENFPRGKLPMRMTRRQFFSGVMDEVRAYSQEENHPYYRLCDLGEMANGTLALIVPVPLPGSEIYPQDGYIWGKPAQARTPIRLFPADSLANSVLQLFNAKNSLANASGILASQVQWDKQRALAYVRGVFLWLVLAKVYVPANQTVVVVKQ